jgi:calcineurin-like phosphoesterase family protein
MNYWLISDTHFNHTKLEEWGGHTDDWQEKLRKGIARIPNDDTVNIHGHTHGNMHRAEEYAGWYDTSFHIDISPEIVGYQPVRLDTLMKGRN